MDNCVYKIELVVLERFIAYAMRGVISTSVSYAANETLYYLFCF
jgi:hypothetical protein